MVLVDGAPLFNTSHLLGFYTNINPDMVQDVSLNKGAFSAQYGGRVSSLLLMSTRNGNKDGWRVSGGLSPVSARVVVDGPISKKLTLLAGVVSLFLIICCNCSRHPVSKIAGHSFTTEILN
ncbi:Plug domain-containing protein [Spirosoma telluris]|uniref:Plug domain-containing protein n=1 Tax=Spirosoma telluris TaxID=2183553 RepID=UPI002FC2B08A